MSSFIFAPYSNSALSEAICLHIGEAVFIYGTSGKVSFDEAQTGQRVHEYAILVDASSKEDSLSDAARRIHEESIAAQSSVVAMVNLVANRAVANWYCLAHLMSRPWPSILYNDGNFTVSIRNMHTPNSGSREKIVIQIINRHNRHHSLLTLAIDARRRDIYFEQWNIDEKHQVK